MDQENTDERTIWELQGLKEIIQRPDIHAKIKFDVTPSMVMEPRFHSKAEDLEKLKLVAVYMFYIESQCNPPALMVMKVGNTDITTTIGKIDEIPAELLEKAITDPAEPPSHGMYAITDDIKTWLKRELGL